MKIVRRCLLVSLLVVVASLAMAQTAVTTYQIDNYRSGANPHETVLTTANVNVSQFGRKTIFAVQGFVYAQPLYLPNLNIGGTSRNVVFIATEHDQVYAFDVSSGQQLWHTNFLQQPNPLTTVSSVPSNDVSCGDLVPEIGITGTPVIDTSTNTMYVIAKTKEYNSQLQLTTYYHTLHALDVTTGRDKITPHRVYAIAHGRGTGSVGGAITFDPLVEAHRSSLLLLNGQVFAAWASHCDLGNYHGWLMSFNESTLALNGYYIDTPNGYEGGFWGGGSGPAADSSGAIYAGTGNGHFNASSGGTDYGDSVMRFAWSNSGIALSDYFTPWDQQTLDSNDTDLGSGGVVLLPDQPGAHYPHLLVQVGKEGTIDLINRDNMGHFHANNDSQIVQTLPYVIGGIWGGPAFWNNTAYFGGIFDHLKAFSFDPQAQLLSVGPTSQSTESYTYPGPTPVVSANGTSNGIVWMIDAGGYGGGSAVLHAYKASNLASELYNSNQNFNRDNPGLALKFTTPTVADGHVFVGAENQVAMYGLLN